MSKPDEWTAFNALLWHIGEHELYPLAADWTIALQGSWDLIIRELECGWWVARTIAPQTYRFRHGDIEIPMGEGGIIDANFWAAFKNAEENSSPLVTLPRAGQSWAERMLGVDGFEFFDLNPGGQPISGSVEQIQIRISRGRLAKGRPGRRPGSSSLKAKDRPIVDKARAFMNATGASAYEAARKFGHEMPGPAGEARKIERLEDTLLEKRSLD